MNGWMAPEPAWWLNLQANPDAVVELKDGIRAIRARAAHGEERERIWGMFGEAKKFAARRPMETAVVVLEPRA